MTRIHSSGIKRFQTEKILGNQWKIKDRNFDIHYLDMGSLTSDLYCQIFPTIFLTIGAGTYCEVEHSQFRVRHKSIKSISFELMHNTSTQEGGGGLAVGPENEFP